MIRCFSCGAETNNGLALCDLHRQAGKTYLEFIPVHFGNLSRWRPGRAGSRPVPGSREPQGAFGQGVQGDRVANCLDEAGNDLTTWVRQLVDDRGVEVPYAGDEVNTVRVACWLLSEHLTSISTLDWCGDLIAGLHDIEARLRALSEQVVPGWYAGACRKCEASTYVMPNVTWVTCQACGTTTHVAAHLEVVLEEARDWTAAPKRIAEALVALIDTEQSVTRLYERIRKWEQRGRIVGTQHVGRGYTWSEAEQRMVVANEAVGRKRYRLGDVLDLVLTETREGRQDQVPDMAS